MLQVIHDKGQGAIHQRSNRWLTPGANHLFSIFQCHVRHCDDIDYEGHIFLQHLFGINREFRPEPFTPTTFKRQHIVEPFFFHLLCHTGTGRFVGSGAIGDKAFVFGVLGYPLVEVRRLGPYRTFDFELR